MQNKFHALTGRKILIVDHSTLITSLLSDVFGACGAFVSKANSGQEAMFLIRLENFELVLLDPVMPPPNGWDLLQFMRRIKPELPAKTILLTCDRYGKDASRAIAQAKMPVVYKPFNIDKLRSLACDVLCSTDSKHVA